MTLITLLLILARPEFRKLMREELKATRGRGLIEECLTQRPRRVWV